jgi:hypothetical protein
MTTWRPPAPEVHRVLRQFFDNAYVANNGRMEVLENMVNMGDLLTSRPNGIVRVKALGAVKRIDNPFLGAPFYNLLEYLDKVKVNRLGHRLRGCRGPQCSKRKGYTQPSLSERSQERINLRARIMAETAVKEIFWKILELECKHQDKPKQVKLRGKWVQIDPREWKNKFNMTVTVGLGTGSQQNTVQSVMAMAQLQGGAIQAGLAGRVVSEGNIYHLLHIGAKALFPREADQLATDPSTLPPKQPEPNPDLLKLQLQKEKQDTSARQKDQKLQGDAQSRALEYMLELKRLGIDVMKLAEDARQSSMDRFHESTQNAMELGHQVREGQKDRTHEHLQSSVDRVLDYTKHKQILDKPQPPAQ